MADKAMAVLYTRARNRGQRGQLWSFLTGRSRCLFTLDEIRATCTIAGTHKAGIQIVPIRHICGTESRARDFDRDFYPLQDHNQPRWLRVAEWRQRGKALPPVDLVQVGHLYFVQDGHHRISVARALGQIDIEANVVVWQVSGPLPWETPTVTGNPSSRETEIGRLNNKEQDDSDNLQERLLSLLNDLLVAVGTRLGLPAGKA